MKPSKRVIASALVLCLAIGANAQWTVVNLHPAGASTSEASGISGGQQAGWTNTIGARRAAVWSSTAASYVDLHPPGIGGISEAYGVDGGQQVGFALDNTRHAYLWTGTAGSAIRLDPPGSLVQATALAVNGGQQVGYATVAGSGWHASLWSGTAASWVDLHPVGMGGQSFAYGIGDGQQAGFVFTDDVLHFACLWTGTAASWVNLHPTGAVESGAYAVSGGQQVGYAKVGIRNRASLWSGSAASWVNLHPTGGGNSVAWGVSGGLQVGNVEVNGQAHASLWSGTASSWVDLHAVLPSTFSVSVARSIYSDGVNIYVAGTGIESGRQVALLWTGPVPDSNFALALNKSSVAGQNSVLGTIMRAQVRPTNTVFTLTDDSSLVTTAPNVTVLAGQLSRNFQISVTAITSTVVTTIYAQRAGITRSQTLTLMPLIPTAIAFTPNQVTGGNDTSCRVVINGVAGPGGRDIAIFDNSPFSTTPSTVTVPAGATDVTFPITTLPVTSIKYVTVTARVSAGEKTGTFRINP
ncbi:MAG: hypothetical protein ABL949_06000 [Fimbriimonadaceae bacterium]